MRSAAELFASVGIFPGDVAEYRAPGLVVAGTVNGVKPGAKGRVVISLLADGREFATSDVEHVHVIDAAGRGRKGAVMAALGAKEQVIRKQREDAAKGKVPKKVAAGERHAANLKKKQEAEAMAKNGLRPTTAAEKKAGTKVTIDADGGEHHSIPLNIEIKETEMATATATTTTRKATTKKAPVKAAAEATPKAKGSTKATPEVAEKAAPAAAPKITAAMKKAGIVTIPGRTEGKREINAAIVTFVLVEDHFLEDAAKKFGIGMAQINRICKLATGELVRAEGGKVVAA